MYNPQQVVGAFFEKEIMQLFDLTKADIKNNGKVPDLISKDNSFFVEVKAAAYDNGGVINKIQLYRFDKNINLRRFYAFAYHSISRHTSIKKTFPKMDLLIQSLDLRSLYLFPFSIVKVYFESSKKRETPNHDTFVQLRESLSGRIFKKDEEIWEKIGLNPNKYKTISLSEKVHLTTSQGNLEKQILESFKQ